MYKEHRRDRAALENEMKKEKFRKAEDRNENGVSLTKISADNEKTPSSTEKPIDLSAGIANAAFVSEHL